MCCEFEEMAIGLARKARRCGGENSKLVQSLMRLLRQHDGGLMALAARFDAEGCGEAMRGWITHGADNTMDGKTMRRALGERLYDKLVRRLDLDPADAAQVLAEIVPMAVNRLTPDGRIDVEPVRPGVQGWFARVVGAV